MNREQMIAHLTLLDYTPIGVKRNLCALEANLRTPFLGIDNGVVCAIKHEPFTKVSVIVTFNRTPVLEWDDIPSDVLKSFFNSVVR